MVNLEIIEQKLDAFRERLDPGFSWFMACNYVCIKRHILEAESMPKEEIMRLATTIKPVVRLAESYPELGAKRNQLVWIKPCPLKQSYCYAFNKEQIILEEGKPLRVKVAKKIAEFTTYHKYGGYPGFLRPSADEVLAQIPSSIDMDKVSAFEITYSTLGFRELYDDTLDRHVLTTILYQIEGGLPEQIKNQEVIWNGKGA